ncbi:MAG: hypothetical protein A2776_01960 [Candidatus Levybacteria bacterium RIFCSPHIGHO2_01_FULL_40_10]|nr:MAG: hypothetical protein A2776_01960 [Candidatus Levybacteria bacterium RIFCSPHIGHO2_01_FULL_40_10]
MNKILFTSIIFLFGSFSAAAFAQDSTVAAKYGITFPIVELGNCQDITSCKNYCEISSNQEVCIAYGKKKGFYKQENVGSSDLIEKAKQELGCDSEESCKTLCSNSANFEKCSSFAKKNNLEGGQQGNPSDNKTLEKAKEVLGCNTPESCKTFCSQPQNQEKCSQFAKQADLRGGVKRVGPGGCDSESSCSAFCSNPDNFSECSKFGNKGSSSGPSGGQNEGSSNNSSGGQGFKGPGGCSSETECRTYCDKNPNECGRNPRGESLENEDGINRGPNRGENVTQNSIDTRDDREKFCRENPEKCKNLQPTGAFTRPSGTQSSGEQNNFQKRIDSTVPSGSRPPFEAKQNLQQQQPAQNNSGPRSGNFEGEIKKFDQKIENTLDQEEKSFINRIEGKTGQEVQGASTTNKLIEYINFVMFGF